MVMEDNILFGINKKQNAILHIYYLSYVPMYGCWRLSKHNLHQELDFPFLINSGIWTFYIKKSQKDIVI